MFRYAVRRVGARVLVADFERAENLYVAQHVISEISSEIQKGKPKPNNGAFRARLRYLDEILAGLGLADNGTYHPQIAAMLDTGGVGDVASSLRAIAGLVQDNIARHVPPGFATFFETLPPQPPTLSAADTPRPPSFKAKPGSPTFVATEAALFGSLTEKFYGSWAFRIAAGTLIVAAALAIGGGFVIGSQVVDVGKASRDAQKAIADTADRTQDRATQLLNAAVESITKDRSGQQRIDAAVTAAVTAIEARQTVDMGQLKTIDDGIAAVTSSVAATKQAAGAIDGQWLVDFVARAKSAEVDLSKTDGLLQDAQASADQARLSASTAREVASAAVASLDAANQHALGSMLASGKVAEKLTAVEAEVTEASARLASLKAATTAAPGLEFDAKDAAARLKSVQDRLRLLEAGLARATIPTTGLAGLSRSDWRAVQSALRQRGFDPGKIDGVYGRRTAAALKGYQRRIGDADTGVLTYPEFLSLTGQ
ncbi:MAG: peptidoglycan-binding protein [Bauldia sp.]